MEKFRILSGLPATGPDPERFSATGLGNHSEGFVVEFHPGEGSSWVGNFQRGGSNFDAVVRHPDGVSLIVAAGGQGYVIDPNRRKCSEFLHAYIESAVPVAGGGILILSIGTGLEAYSKAGLLWRTPRISWDGIWDLREESGRVYGMCWDAAEDKAVPFSVDCRSGEVDGGVLPRPPEL